MKKLLFIFMLIGAGLQLKAQAPLQVKPFNKLPDSFYKKYQFKLPDSLTRLYPNAPNVVITPTEGVKANVTKQYAYNRMPVVKMAGRSNMPVVKMQGNSKMPIANTDAGVNVVIEEKLP